MPRLQQHSIWAGIFAGLTGSDFPLELDNSEFTAYFAIHLLLVTEPCLPIEAFDEVLDTVISICQQNTVESFPDWCYEGEIACMMKGFPHGDVVFNSDQHNAPDLRLKFASGGECIVQCKNRRSSNTKLPRLAEDAARRIVDAVEQPSSRAFTSDRILVFIDLPPAVFEMAPKDYRAFIRRTWELVRQESCAIPQLNVIFTAAIQNDMYSFLSTSPAHHNRMPLAKPCVTEFEHRLSGDMLGLITYLYTPIGEHMRTTSLQSLCEHVGPGE